MELFASVIHYLFLIFVVFFLIEAVAMVNFIWLKRNEKTVIPSIKYAKAVSFLVKNTAFMLLLLGVAVFCKFRFGEIIRGEIKSMVEHYDPTIYKVYVNNVLIEHPEAILNALRDHLMVLITIQAEIKNLTSKL